MNPIDKFVVGQWSARLLTLICAVCGFSIIQTVSGSDAVLIVGLSLMLTYQLFPDR